MSGLHRDKRATNNFSRIWKVREDSGNKPEAKRAQKPGGRQRGRAGARDAEPIRRISWILPLSPLRMNNNHSLRSV
jgi:hypothetical protein